MSGVDNRIVTMQFNNREFEQNAKTSMATLGKLKESLDFGKIAGGAIRGLGAIDSALGKLGLKTPFTGMIKAANTGLAGVGTVLDKIGARNPFASSSQGAAELQRAAAAAGGPGGMGTLEGGVTAVSAKFVALSTIAITALANITNRAVNAGVAWAKGFTFQPIMDGLNEYQTNLKAIQTVQANTDRPLPEINKALQQLNAYSDQTIYNFGEMARNVGTFTAAGVDLQTSVSSIKGIANLAALAGSSSEQAATAMYQLSQAISSGRVGLQDWNSVVNAGMGGKKLQNALAQTAIAMGKIKDSSVQLTGPMKKLTINGESFRESIMAKPGQESWLTSDILVNTLATMDGRFSRYALSQEKLTDGTLKYKTAAEVTAKIEANRIALAKKGVKFTDDQFKALQRMSTNASKSATEVKTLGQVFDIAKETIGSGWSASFNNIFGNLKEAKKLFTGMSNGLNSFINANALARNNLLAAWKKGGGRDTIIDGLKNAFKALQGVLGPVMQGFRDIFPKKTVSNLLDMSNAFEAFTKKLIPSKKTMEDIRTIAGGVFAVFGIGKSIIGGVVDGFKALFGAMGAGNGDFLSFAAGIAQNIKDFNEFLKKSGIVTTFFVGIGKILAVPLGIFKGLGQVIAALFGGFDEGAANKMGDAVGGVGDKLSGLAALSSKVANFVGNIGELFGKIGKVIGKAVVNVGQVIAKMFTPETFSQTLDVVNTSLLGALVLLIRNFFNKGFKIDLTGGAFAGIKQTLGEATKGFELMQQNLKANILLKLAAAIGVMALALLVLSGIDPKSLTKALAAMTGGFAILIGAMGYLLKVMGPAGIVQLYVITSGMTKMALSILLLSFALKTLAGIQFGDMVRGLVGLGATLLILTKAMVPLAANSKGMAKASLSLIAMGIAMNIMAVALKIFASMSWEEMVKGLAGLTGTLLALGVGLKLMPPLQAEALGLIALGVALNLIAVSMKIFATMSWEEMAKGLVGLAGSLLIISAAINTMPKTMLLQAAGLLVLSGALVVLSGALKVMGSMGWEEIAKGLVVLAGSLLVIVAALNFMGPSALLGAAALVVVAVGLNALLPVLLAFGAMKWSTLLKSLAGLALVFVVLGAAGYALAPVVTVILGLGAALLLMGAGIALAGAGVLAIATAFGIVAAAGAAGITVLTGLLSALIAAIPPALTALALGLVQFVVAIGAAAPQIAAAFGNIMTAMLNTVITNAPKVAQAFLALLSACLKVIGQAVPMIANAGLKLIGALLGALARNIPNIAKKGTDAVLALFKGIGDNAYRLVDAGLKLILKLMDGLAKAIQNNSEEFGKKGADIGIAIIEGTLKGIKGGAGEIIKKLKDIAKDAWNAAKDFFGIGGPSKLMCETVGKPISQGMAGGIEQGGSMVVDEIGSLGKHAASKMDEVMKGVNDAFSLNSDLNQPTIAPVLDLSGVTKEAAKMSSILATAPVMATVSYQAASDISTMTTQSNNGGGPEEPGVSGNGGTNVDLTLELHSPKAIDSVDAWRAGKSLISLAKEALQ